MRYYIERYGQGLRRVRRWLPLVLLPPVVYLLVAAAAPDRYFVSQRIAVQQTAPIALSKTPVDFSPMSEIMSRPSELYLDDFAIMDLTKLVARAVPGARESEDLRDLKGTIEACMSLKPDSDGHVRVEYYGPDIDRGKFFVNYFAQRLISRSKDGLVRSQRNMNRSAAGALDTSGVPIQSQPQKPAVDGSQIQSATLAEEMQVQAHRSLWRCDRLLPFTAILLVSLVFWFILAGVAEWTDPSFKSERQVSRYLNIPVIGVMPDLGPLIRRLQL